MASKNQDVHLRLFFDGAKAAKTYDLLIGLQEEYNKKLEEAKKAAKSKGVDPKVDEDVKLWKGKVTILNSMLKEAKKATTDIHNALKNLSQQSLADLDSYIKYLEKRISGMSMKKKGAAAESAKLRGQLDQLYQERDRRNSTKQNRPLAEIQKDLQSSDASIDKLRRLRQELEHFRNFATTQSNRDSATKEISKLDERLKQMNAAPLRELSAVLANIGNANNGSIVRLKELREELVRIQQTSTNKNDVKLASEAILELDKRIASMTGVTMKGADAEKAFAEAQKAIKNGVKGRADVVRELIVQMQQAQKAEGISVQQAQQYANAEKQLTTMLKTQAETVMTSAQAHLAYNEAKRVLAAGENANAAAVRNSIEQMRQAQQAEGVTVQTTKLYVEIQKKLEQQLTNTAVQYMRLRDVKRIVQQGENARVTDINRAISSLQRLAKAEGTTAAQAKNYNTLIKQLEASMKGASNATEKVAYDAKFLSATMANLNKAKPEDLEKAILMLKNRMKDAKTSLTEYVKASIQLRQVKQQMQGVNSQIQLQADFFTRATSKLMSYLGIFGGFYLLRQKLTEAFQANIKYDDSLSNIRKTTGLTSEAVAMLADNIKRITTRTTLQEMNDLAYSAGRLGVKGVSDVMGFVKAANQINIALGEQLNGAESVEQLMKITELMGENKEHGLEKALLKTGSAINHITMNSQATAQPMVDFMRRTAGVATQAGITTAELAGLSGAVNALGQNVEMSATSISKMLVQMEKNSKAVAKALNMSLEEETMFVNNLRTGHAMDAFLFVLEKTKDAGGLSHLGQIVKDLGSEGQRVIQTIATLSTNYEKVKEMVDMSTDAYERGTSVTNEYNIKNQNTAALWEKLKNSFSKLFVSPRAIEWIKAMLEQLQDLPQAVSEIVRSLSWLGDVFGLIIKSISSFTTVWKSLIYAMMMRGFISAVAGIGLGITNIGKSFSVAQKGARGFFTYLRSASFGNIFTALATVLTTIAFKIFESKKAMEEWQKEIGAGVEKAKEEFKGEQASINAMLAKLKEANDGTIERGNIIAQLNKTYGTFLDNMLDEAMGYGEIATALEAVNAQLETKALLEGRSNAMNKVREDNYGNLGSARRTLLKAIVATMSGEDVQANETAASNIIDQLIKQDDKGNYEADKYVKKYTEDGKTKYKSENEKKFVINYDNAYGSESTGEWVKNVEFLDNVNKLFEGIGASISATDFSKLLADYMNVQSEIDSKLADLSAAYDTDLRIATGKSYSFFADNASNKWEKISDNVTLGGTLTDYTKLTREDEVAMADRRDKMSIEERKEESKNLSSYLVFAKQVLTNLQGKDTRNLSTNREDWTDEYREAYDRNMLAETWQTILGVGTLENAENKKEKADAIKDARKEYENIIKKIEEYYALQASERNRQKNNKDITSVELEEYLKKIDIEKNKTLAMARYAITGDVSETEWRSQLASLNNIAGKDGLEALSRMNNVKNLQGIGTIINDGTDDGNEFINSIRANAAKNINEVEKITIELADAVRKAWRDQNPLGKITDEWFDTFQKLDIMFGETPLEKNREEIMKAYREIGEEAYKFDIKTVDGMEHFKETVMNMPILKDQLKALEPDQLDEALRKIYYKAYEYAEQYNEAMTRLVTKQQNLWKRMFAANFVTMESEMDKLFTEQMKQINNFMENFGLSKRIGLENEIKSRQQTLKKAYQEWMYMRQRAEAALEAAKKSGDVDEIKQAEEHIKTLEKPTSAVISAFKSVEEAQLALRLSNHEWLASVEKSIEKFSDDFIKLQSWYDINMHRNMVDNMFGSKDDRQKAFATFMDDLKRYMREAMVEYTREKVSKWILDKLPKKKKEDTENQMVTEAKSAAEELKKIDKDVADNKNDLQQQAVDNHSKALSVRLDNESSYYEASIQQYENYIAELESIDYSYETFLRNMRLADGDDSLLLASNNDNMLGEVVKDMKTMGQSISGQYAKDKTTDKTDEQAGSYYRTPGDLQYDEKFIAGDIRSKADSSYQKGHPLENEMKGFVIHMTGSNASADSIAKNVFNPGNTKSAWAVINKDGSRVMMMQPNEVAGHAGIGNTSGTKGTQWKNYGDPTLDKPNANDYMIGIENVGNANKEQLTEAQMKSMLEAMMPIILAQRIPLENIVSHGEVAPGYKADVSKDDIVRFRQFLKENLYDLYPKLPLTSADADAYWAQPDWKEKWNKETNGKQWTPYPTEVDKSYEYNGPRPSGKVVSAPDVKESAKELVDAIKADLPTVVNVTEPYTPYPTEVDKSYEYNGPRPSGKVVSAPDANLGAGEIPTGVIGQGLDMTAIEELRKNNYYGSAILAILEESKVADANPIDSQGADNDGSSNAGQSLILGNPESSEEENSEGTWLDKQMAKVPELKASYEDLAKERGEQIANIVMAEDQGEATINAIKSEAAKQSSQIIQKSTDKVFNIKKKEINKEQKTEKAANKAKAKEEENVNNELLQSAEDLAASTIKVDSKVKDVKVSNSAVASQEIQKDEAETATTSMWGSFGGAMAKAWEVGGPYLGPILAGVVSAALGAVMSMVFNMIGGGKDSATAVPKTKLVTGMLTYDKGNVQSWRVGPVKTYASGNTEDFVPVMGDDGKVYYASQANDGLATGMVTRPTLTTVNGVPSLVGERGPEMVIGRETTAAMQMYAPELLKQIVLFDRNRSNGYAKTYDSGNVGTITVDDNDNENENMRTMLLAMNEALNQSNAINAQLVAQLQKGIAAHINKNGAGGLIDEVASGLVETRRMGTNKNVTRLFG